jgi:hypothetical protein
MKYSVIILLAAFLILGNAANGTLAFALKCDAELYE